MSSLNLLSGLDIVLDVLGLIVLYAVAMVAFTYLMYRYVAGSYFHDSDSDNK